MRQGPAAGSEEEAGSLREFLHKLRLQPTMQPDQVILPSVMKEVIKHFSDGSTLDANLQNFTNGTWGQTVNVPSVDLPFFVAQQNLAQISVSVPFLHEL